MYLPDTAQWTCSLHGLHACTVALHLHFIQTFLQCNLCNSQVSVQVMRSAVITNLLDPAQFFWDHLKTDLRIIGKCLSKGENEVLMMLHRIIHQLAGRQPTIGRCTKVGSVVTQMYNSSPEYILHNCCVIHTCRCWWLHDFGCQSQGVGRPVPATGTGTKPAGIILCRLFVGSPCILVTFIMHFIPHCTLVCRYRDPRVTEHHCCRQWYSTCMLLYAMQLCSHACTYVSLTCIKLPSGFWREQCQAWAGSWLNSTHEVVLAWVPMWTW